MNRPRNLKQARNRELWRLGPPKLMNPPPKRPRKPAPRWLKTTLITLLVLITIAAVALATFVILAQAAPDFIDSILYTPEELRIINY